MSTRTTTTDNQHFDEEGCPCSGNYEARRASGEVLGTFFAADQFDAYDQAEGHGLPLHYVVAVVT